MPAEISELMETLAHEAARGADRSRFSWIPQLVSTHAQVARSVDVDSMEMRTNELLELLRGAEAIV